MNSVPNCAYEQLGSGKANQSISARLAQWVPMLDWLPRYEVRAMLVKDLSCGITLGCILLGQSLAHANLVGVDVIHGPYSCLLPPVVYAMLGTCNQASVGTGGLVALLTGIRLQGFHDREERARAAAIICVLEGLLLSLMGLLQLSFLVRFLSRPALSGFITGSALLIMKAMLLPMLGMPDKYQEMGLIPLLREPKLLLLAHPATILISFTSFMFLFNAKRIPFKKLKELKELIILALAALVCYLGAAKCGVEVVGQVPTGLPTVTAPLGLSKTDWELATELLPGAGLIAVVTFISSFASAKKCALAGGYQVLAFNELIALGMANMAGGFSGAVPTQIGLSRSALALSMGVMTPVGANLFVAATVALIVLFLAPLLYYVPRCVLNAIIVNAAYGLFEFFQARRLWSYHDKLLQRKDFGIWLVAFLGTLTFGAFEGILLAVAISLLLAIQAIVNPNIDVLGKRELLPSKALIWSNIKQFPQAQTKPGILVLRLDGPMFYANSERFQECVEELEQEWALDGKVVEAVILNAASIPFVDATAVQVLREMLETMTARGVALYIANAYGEAGDLLQKVLKDVLTQRELGNSIDACIDMHERRRQVLSETAPHDEPANNLLTVPEPSSRRAFSVRVLPRNRSEPAWLNTPVGAQPILTPAY